MPPHQFFSSLGLFVLPDFFDPAFRARLAEEMTAAGVTKGTIVRPDGRDGVLEESSRRVLSAHVGELTCHSVSARFHEIQATVEEHFQINLGDCESPNFLKYDIGAFYRPHKDTGPNVSGNIARRRISVVVFVNGQSHQQQFGRFGGGDLAFYGLIKEGKWEKCAFTLDAEPGLLVAFPSETLHEVRPVSFGQRLTVVSWFLGQDSAKQQSTSQGP